MPTAETISNLTAMPEPSAVASTSTSIAPRDIQNQRAQRIQKWWAAAPKDEKLRVVLMVSVIAVIVLGVVISVAVSGGGSSGPDTSSGPYQYGYQNAYSSGLQQVQTYGTSGNAAGQEADQVCEQQMVFAYSGQNLQDADAGCRQAAADLASRYP